MILKLICQFSFLMIFSSQLIASYDFVKLENSWTDVNKSISELNVYIDHLVNSTLNLTNELDPDIKTNLLYVKTYYQVMINYMENSTLSQLEYYKKLAKEKKVNIDECLKNADDFKKVPEKSLETINSCMDAHNDPLKDIRKNITDIPNELPPLFKHLIMCGQVDENCIRKVAKEVADTKDTFTKKVNDLLTAAKDLTKVYESFLFRTCGDKQYEELMNKVSKEFKVTADCIDDKINHFE